MSQSTPDYGVVTVRTSYFKGKPHATERRVTETFKPTEDYQSRITDLSVSEVVQESLTVHYKFSKAPVKKLKLVIVEYLTEKSLDKS